MYKIDRSKDEFEVYVKLSHRSRITESPFINSTGEYMDEGSYELNASSMDEACEEVKCILLYAYPDTESIEESLADEDIDSSFETPVEKMTIVQRSVVEVKEFDIDGYLKPLLKKQEKKEEQEDLEEERKRYEKLKAKFEG